MTRTFKLSFPMPGRRPQSRSPNPTPPGSQMSIQYSDLDDHLLYHPSPKVHEVLGAATPDSNASSNRRSGKERTSRRKPSGFMNVALADYGENKSAREEGGSPSLGAEAPGMLHPNNANQPSRPSLYGMNRHGSSPLLGEHAAIHSTTSQIDYFSADHSSPWPRPRQASSLSALRSHYEKPPLSETYQNMDLTANNMADQKGESQITRSRTSPHVPQRTHSRNQSGTSKGSNGSNNSARIKIDGMPRRRPSVNDPPTLYPNAPKPFVHAVSPPPALINSSLPKSIQAGQASPLSFGKPRWWEKKRPKTSPIIELPEKIDHGPLDGGIASAKVNVRRPKKGITNWFDAVETDESSLSHYSDLETGDDQAGSEAMQQQHGLEHPITMHEVLAQDPPRTVPADTSRKSSFNDKNKRAGQSDRKLSFKLDSSPPQYRQGRELTQTKSTARTSFVKSAPGTPTGRNSRTINTPRGIPLKDADLQVQSVLNLSSSSDEEETEAESSAPESSYRGHRIRASIERAEYSNEVHLGNAFRVQPLKPKPVINRQSERSSYRRSQMSPSIPPVPQIPSHPPLTKRNSSMRWRALLGDKAAESRSQSQNPSAAPVEPSESTVDSGGESSLNGNTPPSSQSPSTTRHSGSNKRSSTSAPLRRGSKLMSVTSEEETLLEAMREKRASIRATDFQKGFNSAMQLHIADYLNRPKTSGADGRTSRSSIYGAGSSRGSISPPLLGPSVYRPPNGQFQPQHQHHPSQSGHLYHASLGAQSGLSASTDNLTLEDAYPFPEVPSEPIPSNITRTSVCRSEASPSLTYSTSDMLPSTPSTFNSPLTPPSEPVPALPSFSFSSSSHRGSLVMGAYGIVKGGMGFPGRSGDLSSQHSQQQQPKHQQQLEVKPAISASAGGGGSKAGPGQYGHERRETGSSSVVVLDGVESYAAKLDEENEISGWAFDSGMDRW